MKNSIKWTPDQQKVIELRNRNILVSAAAGSGKTAVLVQRIIQMITDKTHPVDVDKLLIVTFTKAAAREMRERIGKAIDKELMKNPQDINLQKQSVLVRNAHITTIDSFCLNIIKNYFNEIDLIPGFRIADENELSLIKVDVIGEVLEKYYEEGSKEFLDMIEKYASSRTDKNIEELIINLHGYSMSYPWPEEWLNDLKGNFNLASIDDLDKSLWMNDLKKHIYNIVYDVKEDTEYALELCSDIAGPSQYIENFQSDLGIYNSILKAESYSDLYKALNGIKFSALSRKRNECDESIKERVKSLRDKGKKVISDLTKKYFYQSPEEMYIDIKESQESIHILVDITSDFLKKYAEEKEKRNILDFSDIEHYALDILVNKSIDNGEEIIEPTRVAYTLSNYYEEILIDEYQDSNYVQETLLNSISKEKFGNPNVFMVGDVKQSIYKFRMAKPELFIDKYDAYSSKDSEYQKIDLCQNFRSRQCVIDGINEIFKKIMTRKLGNIEYDDKARLYNGASYIDSEDTSKNCELIMVETKVDVDKSDNSEEFATENVSDDILGNALEDDKIELTKREMEAKAIAKRIKELVNGKDSMEVQAKDSNGESILRPAQYKDVVILLRGLNGWSEVLLDVFAEEGIPINIETRTGYFSALEIRLTLNMLKVINNPRQDIPLMAVLRSVVGGLSNEEVALVRGRTSSRDLYDAIIEYKDKNSDEIAQKLEGFISKINDFRRIVPFTPIHELIRKVLADTGYYTYVYAMNDGDRRRMNLDMLVEKAIEYEKTSYKGLFNFIRFIERMVKYDIDFGEAGASNGNDNYVRVMTIHKSKGLEFPIVFLAGMGQQFNMSDTKGKILIHSEYGIAPDYIDTDLRVKCPTLMKNVIASKIKEETVAEELRILYVALTRAKEKLILTGALSDVGKKLDKYSMVFGNETETFTYNRIESEKTYFDLVIPAIMDNMGFSLVLEDYDIDQESIDYNSNMWLVNVADLNQQVKEEAAEEISKEIDKEDILNWAESEKKLFCKKLLDRLKQEKTYKYAYDDELSLKGKFSVSELKKMETVDEIENNDDDELSWDEFCGMYEEIIDENGLISAENEEDTIEDVDDEEMYVPEFIRGESTEIKANERGNAYHKVMELLDYSKISSENEVGNQIQSFMENGYITKEQYDSVNKKDIYKFASSSIGKRIQNAKEKKLAQCEQPFVIGIPAKELFDDESKGEDNILIQGIIDLFFEEDDGIVLVDYKTDRVTKKDGETLLIERYSKQLELYKTALERMTGKTVKEKIIYSFALGKEIVL